jgi:hypothetical protein
MIPIPLQPPDELPPLVEPVPGRKYQGWLGVVVEVVCVATGEPSGVPLVVYRRPEGACYACTLADWNRPVRVGFCDVRPYVEASDG